MSALKEILSQNQFLTTSQVAKMLGVSPKTIQRLAKGGAIRSYSFISEFRFKEEELMEDIERLRTKSMIPSQLRAANIR